MFRISVVIPAYNAGAFIARAVRSVLAQSRPADEVIVVDDGSTDDTAELLGGYGDKVRVVTLASCHGVSHARNIGVQTCCSPWIAFLDSDDEWTKEKLACQWAHLWQHPFLQISQCEEIWIRDGIRVNRCKHHEKKAGFIFSPSLKMCLVSPSAVIMKRDLFETYGLFDETLPACEDYDLWLRILRDFPVGLNLDPSLIKFGGHEDQLSRRYSAMDRFRLSALTAALARERCYGQRQEIRQVIAGKARIMAGGCRKRGKSQEADQYDEIVAEMLKEEMK
jgi:GT2 family glycosyltransferase